MANLIRCPHCKKTFELTDAIRHQIEEEVSLSVSKKYEQELLRVKKESEEKVKKQIEDKVQFQIKDLKKQLSEKDEKVSELRENELKLREDRRKLKEKEKELNLEVQRKLDTQRKKIEERVLNQATEEHRLKDKEKDKVIEDLKNSLDDARRKASQGSQQLQGEILELDVESLLRDSFPNDQIEAVEKGVKGADIRQIVKSPKGYVGGVILWEIKRTKAWKDSWITKLKEDLRAEKANVPVIISISLPKDIKSGFELYKGVWVVGFNLVLPVATIIRKNLLDVLYQKAVASHKGGKSEVLYEYITSHEFKQQLEAMVEVYREIQGQIIKEKAAYARIWKLREGQMQRLISSTANVVGSIQGRIGQAVLPVKGLELLSEGEEKIDSG